MRATMCLIAFAALFGGIAPAAADETGLDVIHGVRKFGNKTCFDEHYHDGSGAGPTQKAAIAQAARAWESFTALEYGSDWGSYAKSVKKSVTCDHGSTGFTCNVSAIPCKGRG